MSNIKTRLFLILTITLMLAVGISAISATDSSEISTNITQQTSVDVDVVSDNIETTYDVDDTSVSSSSSAQSDDLAATKLSNRNVLRDDSYVINQNNYDTYFNSEGYLNSISEGTELIFSGSISGKTMYIDVPVNITSESDETELINCSINVLMDAEGTNITNLVFTDNDYTETVIYIDEAYYVSIQNVRINQENTNGKTRGIHAYGADGLTIEGCVINVKGPDVDALWENPDGMNYVQTICTVGLYVDSCYDSFIIGNIINTERIAYATDNFATIKSLVIVDSDSVIVDSNTISSDASRYTYCFEFSSSSNCELTGNVITVVSDYYTCGIESRNLGEDNIIENNNITLITINRNNVSDTQTVSYGIFLSDVPYEQTITYNNVISQAGAIYLVEFFQVHNCNVSYNNLTGDGEKSLGIGAYNSSNNYFAYNNINVTGTNSKGNVGVDSIPVETTGLVLLSQSNNNTFDNNIVDLDSPITSYMAHIISGNNNSVINNQLKNKGTLVNATVYDEDGSTIIYNNSNTDTTLKNVTIEGINVTDYTLTDVIIEVIVLDEDHEPVNEGTVEFTDADGNVLGSSNVTEGIANITTVFDTEYNDVVIVTYSGTDSYAASEGSINVTINKKNTNIVIDDIGEVKLGDTVTINVTLSSGDNLSGEAVTLTVNNQTLTNTTENGIAKFDVTFNDAGEYKIVASYEGSTAYNGTKTNVTLSVEALDTVVEATVTSPVKYGADVTINGTIKDENGKLLEGIDAAIYVNGVEVTNVTTGDDGTFTYEFTADTIGLNNVTVESVATTNYNSNSYSTNFQVQSTITMTANPINASINDTITISVNVVDQDNIPLNEGIIVFTDNNDNVLGNASVVNGNAAITYKFEKYYDGTVTATFKGTDAYDTTSIEIPVTINRFDVTLQALGMQSVVINQNTSVMVFARRGDYPVSLSLTLTLPNGLIINSTSTGVISQFNYNISDAGAYELTVMYAGSDIYNPANISFEQIINPSNLHMDSFGLSNYIIYFDEGTNITGILVDTHTGNPVNDIDVIIYINDIEVGRTKTNSTGGFLYQYDGSDNLIYDNNVTVKTVPTNNYPKQYVKEIFLLVKELNTTMNASDVKGVVDQNVTITVDLNDQRGKPVIDGNVIFTDSEGNILGNTTVENGVATLIYKFDKLYNGIINASYVENYKYNSTSVIITANIDKANSSIAISSPETMKVNEEAIVNVTVITGDRISNGETITLKISDDVTLTNTTVNGVASFTVSYAEVGTYTLNASYGGNEAYNEASELTNISISMFTVNISGDNVTGLVNKQVTISVTVIDENGNNVNEGKVIFTDAEGNVLGESTVVGGVASINKTFDTDYNGIVTANYTESDIYSSASTNISVVINKQNSSIAISDIGSVKAGDIVTIDVTVSSGNELLSGETVTLKVNNQTLTNITEEGVAKFDVEFSDAGEYEIVASYDGSAVYNGDEANVTLYVGALDTTVEAQVTSPVKYGADVTVSGTVKDENGVLLEGIDAAIYVNGVEVANVTTNANGTFTYEFTADTLGLNNVTVESVATNNYNSNEYSTTFEVESLNVTITGADVTGTTLSNVTISVSVVDENGEAVNGGTVVFTDADDNVLGSDEVVQGSATLTTVFDKEYDGIVTVTYAENGIYSAGEGSVNVAISKITTNITINPIETVVGEEITISIDVVDANGEAVNGGTVELKDADNNTIATMNVTNGIASTQISFDEYYDDVVYAIYSGTDSYNKSEATSSLLVNKLNSSIIIGDIGSVKAGDIVTIDVTVSSGDELLSGETVTLKVNNQTFTNTTENGVAKFDVEFSDAGEYEIVASYEGSAVYNGNEANVTLSVEALDTTVEAQVSSPVKYGADVTVRGTIKDENGVLLEGIDAAIYVNGVEVANVTTDADGAFAYEFAADTLGLNNVTVESVATNNYNSNEYSTTFEVESLNVTITGADVNGTALNDVVILVSVVDENGEAVNGGTVVFTDADGNVLGSAEVVEGSANITTVFNKEYDGVVTVSYDENGIYSAGEGSVNVVISKVGTDLKIIDVDTVKIGENVIINVVLTDENNTLLSGKDVTITVNNQTLTNTTEEGVAKFTLNFTDAGEYEIVASYAGDDAYEGSSSNITVTVEALNTIIEANATNVVKYGADVTINGIIKDENDELLEGIDATIYVNGVAVANVTTDADGAFTYDYTADTLGLNNVTVESVATNNYNSNNYSTTFAVESLNVTITGTDVSGTTLSNVTIVVSVVDENGEDVTEGTVVFTDVNGKVLGSAEVVEGSASITTVFNKVYGDVVTVSYAESGIYSAGEGSVNVTISKIASTVTIDPVEGVIGEVTTIVANVVDANGNPVNGGRVVFKYNGKTLKDADGNVVQANVVNGVATVDFVVPDSWRKAGNLSAKYGGTSAVDTSDSQTVTPTVSLRNVTITVAPQANTAEAGDSVIYVVVVSDAKTGTLINGVVVVKMAGVTIGQVEVVNGIGMFNYTIPTSRRAGDYNMSFVFSNSTYNRAEYDNATLTVKLSQVYLEAPAVVVHGNETGVVKATVRYTNTGEVVNTPVSVAIKVNGKTVDSSRYSNGNIEFELPASYRDGSTITIAVGATYRTAALRKEIQYIKIN